MSEPLQTTTLGTMHVRDGAGAVWLQVHVGLPAVELWRVLTEPDHLRSWLGEVDGDLREGGTFRARWTASGWEGTCSVLECRPPERLLLHTRSEEEPDGVVELRLSEDGTGTLLVLEDSGLPAEGLEAYAAGDQIHLEDLLAHVQGRPRCDARARWHELHDAYLAHGMR